MNTPLKLTLICAALAASAPAWSDDAGMQGMTMSGMDMSAPAKAAPPAKATPEAKSTGMSSGMSMPPAAAPATTASPTRTANDASDGYTLDTGPYIPAGVVRPHLADEHRFGSVLVDRLETAGGHDSGSWNAYDVQAWYGLDFNRLVLKAEGQESHGRLQDARTEVLWGHAVAPFWDTQLGVRHDGGDGPDSNWLAAGIQGLAPYWFDVEATAYLGDNGRSALRLNLGYELLLTQRVVLRPQIEVNAYGRDDPSRGIGAGLADATAGLRLRYDITRQFSPYVGVEWSGRFGRTADLARQAGQRTSATDLVAGVHLWF